MDSDEFKFNLGQCKRLINGYKKDYMRKNSKYPCVIQLRCHARGIDKRFWKYYLELWINGEMKDQTLILPEAYDALGCDPSLKKEEMKNLEFITIETFTPENKQLQNQ